VEWVDSSGFSGGETWQDKADVIRQAKTDEGCLCWSVGYVVYEDDRAITLTLSHNGKDGMVMDPTIIPRRSILLIRDVERVLPVCIAT
jgi:hypothetical protein